MPLMILGLIFVVGIFAYYMFSTSGSGGSAQSSGQAVRADSGKGFYPGGSEGSA